MSKEKIALLLGSDYGIRVVHVIEDECGKYHIVEPNPPIWVNSWYSDDPPVDVCDDGFGDPYMVEEEYWIPIDDEEDV